MKVSFFAISPENVFDGDLGPVFMFPICCCVTLNVSILVFWFDFSGIFCLLLHVHALCLASFLTSPITVSLWKHKCSPQNCSNNNNNVILQSVEADVINHFEATIGKSSNTSNAGNCFVGLSTSTPIGVRVSDQIKSKIWSNR